MSRDKCPVCSDPQCVKSNDLFRGWPCCNAERLAIERAAELDAIKTALGCQGMSLADTLKVVEVLKESAYADSPEIKPKDTQ